MADTDTDNVEHILGLLAAGENKTELPQQNFESFRLAKVVRTDLNKNRVFIRFFGTDMFSQGRQVEAIYPGFMGAPDGTGFWHGLSKGDTVLVTNTKSDKFIILNKLTNVGSSSLNVDSIIENISPPGPINITDGMFAIRAKVFKGDRTSELMTIEAVPGSGILLGMNPFASLFIDLFPKTGESSKYDSVLNLSSGQNNTITEAGYNINGVVYRSIEQPTAQLLSARHQERWYSSLQPICLDPTNNRVDKTEDQTRIKNPPFVERREMIYEFAENANVESDSSEEKKQNYETSKTAEEKFISRLSTSRRARKHDILSLSLVAPNCLMETVKGTLVDVYGNILDLNRNRLPVGRDENIKIDGTEKSYNSIREQHRRGVAFHWELNARKTPKEAPIETGTGIAYAKTESTYTRERRRFFIDVDKEGQFKINVPCSSETGNIALIANYENTSTINPKQDDYGNNYDTFVMPEKGKQDILLDAYGKGCITLKGSEKLIPVDRITDQPIKLGTVFHDISKTCCEPVFIDPEDKDLGAAIFAGPDGGPDGKIWTSVITKEVNIDGDSANAGGRSGTITFDGMLNMSIGANTVDRQSLWFDTAGGIISRIGRDKNDISVATQLDGHYYMQIGGNTINDDNRFSSLNNNANKNFIFEVRLIDGNNNYHRINIDQHGILLRSAGDIRLEAKDNIVLHGASVISNCEIEEKHTGYYDLEIWKHAKMLGVIARLIASSNVGAYNDGLEP